KRARGLSLRGAVNPRVGPMLVPAIEIGLGGGEGVEAESLQRRPLRMADAGFDLAFAIRIADATRQCDGAVVREHVAIEWIERRIVEVRCEDAFFQVVEDDHGGGPTPPPQRAAPGVSPAAPRPPPPREPA